MDTDTGPLGDLCLQGAAQVVDVPLGGVITPAKGRKDVVVVVVAHPVLPHPPRRPIKTADPLDLRPAESAL
jgi:hypothetical protein